MRPLSAEQRLIETFVDNIDYGTVEGDVRELFARYGTVETVILLRARETGRPRGFGYVEMPDLGEASRAIEELNDAMLLSRFRLPSLEDAVRAIRHLVPRAVRDV